MCILYSFCSWRKVKKNKRFINNMAQVFCEAFQEYFLLTKLFILFEMLNLSI